MNTRKDQIEQARRLIATGISEYLKEVLEKQYPELKESEDERIRKAISVAICGTMAESNLEANGVKLTEALSYLKKQKEQKPKMTPKWLYRLEFKDSSCGLWYDGSGKWCFESGIGSIGGCKTKTLPMDYDARYKQDGRDWFSSCSRKEDLMHWYSLEDVKELISKGFVFTRYLATEYHEYEQQTVFIKETALYREEIDIFELFGQKPPEWSEEDEKMRLACIDIIEHFPIPSGTVYGPWGDCINWLKSLRPQPHWKPSEEQMEALENCFWDIGEGVPDEEKLRSLYNDLKKLL